MSFLDDLEATLPVATPGRNGASATITPRKKRSILDEIEDALPISPPPIGPPAPGEGMPKPARVTLPESTLPTATALPSSTVVATPAKPAPPITSIGTPQVTVKPLPRPTGPPSTATATGVTFPLATPPVTGEGIGQGTTPSVTTFTTPPTRRVRTMGPGIDPKTGIPLPGNDEYGLPIGQKVAGVVNKQPPMYHEERTTEPSASEILEQSAGQIIPSTIRTLGQAAQFMGERMSRAQPDMPIPTVASAFAKPVMAAGKAVESLAGPEMDPEAVPKRLQKDLLDDPSLLLDPKWYALYAPQAAGSMATFLLAGMVGGPLLAAATESLMEAGNTYASVRDATGDESQAGDAAAVSFATNLAITYPEGLLFFAKGSPTKLLERLPTKIRNLIAVADESRAGRTLTRATAEGAQEVGQEKLADVAERPYIPDRPKPQYGTVGAMGAFMGGGAAVGMRPAGMTIDQQRAALAQTRTTDTGPEATGPIPITTPPAPVEHGPPVARGSIESLARANLLIRAEARAAEAQALEAEAKANAKIAELQAERQAAAESASETSSSQVPREAPAQQSRTEPTAPKSLFQSFLERKGVSWEAYQADASTPEHRALLDEYQGRKPKPQAATGTPQETTEAKARPGTETTPTSEQDAPEPEAESAFPEVAPTDLRARARDIRRRLKAGQKGYVPQVTEGGETPGSYLTAAGGVRFDRSIRGELQDMPKSRRKYINPNGTGADILVDRMRTDHPEWGIETESDLIDLLREGGDRLTKSGGDFGEEAALRREAERTGNELDMMGPTELQEELARVQDRIKGGRISLEYDPKDQGKPNPKYRDLIDWLDEKAKTKPRENTDPLRKYRGALRTFNDDMFSKYGSGLVKPWDMSLKEKIIYDHLHELALNEQNFEDEYTPGPRSTDPEAGYGKGRFMDPLTGQLYDLGDIKRGKEKYTPPSINLDYNPRVGEEVLVDGQRRTVMSVTEDDAVVWNPENGKVDVVPRSTTRKVPEKPRPRVAGSDAILERIAQRVRQEKLDPDIGDAARAFVISLQDTGYLDDLGISIRAGIPEGPQGRYQAEVEATGRRSDAVVSIFYDAATDPRVGIHEISHHLEQFVPDADLDPLRARYETEKAAYEKRKSVMSTLGRAGRGEFTAEGGYRYKSFGEYFAERMADLELVRQGRMKVEADASVWIKPALQLKHLLQEWWDAVKAHLSGDVARRIYRNLQLGRYGIDEEGPTYRRPSVARYEADATPAEPFYSNIRRTVEAKMGGSAEHGALASMLQNSPGVKPEELEDTGILDWLFRQEGKVRKEDVLRYLDENTVKVEIKEHDMTGKTMTPFQEGVVAGPYETQEAAEADAIEAFPGEDYQIEEDGMGFYVIAPAVYEEGGVPAERQLRYPLYTHGDYWTPGGENHREMLLTLPQREAALKENSIRSDLTIVESPGESRPYHILSGGEIIYKGESRERAERVLEDSVRRRLEEWKRKEPERTFKSPHFDEPNILAHLRLADYEGPSGERVLLVDEAQSDWHGAARRVRANEIDRLVQEQGMKLKDAARRVPENFGYKKDTPVSGGPGIPDAPYKRTWHERAMREAIRFAKGEPAGYPAGDDDPDTPVTFEQLDRPLDFVALTDHAEFLGAFELICELGGTLPAGTNPACNIIGNNIRGNIRAFVEGTTTPFQILIQTLLAESPTDANREFARWLWSKTAGYDFADYQLEADDALMALGLARRGVDPKHPDDGEMVVYGPPR